MIGVHTYPFKEEHSIPGTWIRTLTRLRPLLLCASPINAGSEKDFLFTPHVYGGTVDGVHQIRLQASITFQRRLFKTEIK